MYMYSMHICTKDNRNDAKNACEMRGQQERVKIEKPVESRVPSHGCRCVLGGTMHREGGYNMGVAGYTERRGRTKCNKLTDYMMKMRLI